MLGHPKLKSTARLAEQLPNMRPPAFIDGARVIEWARSDIPFGVGYAWWKGNGIKMQIHGLAISQYEGQREFYSFACNAEWECMDDTTHDSLERAKSERPPWDVQVIWHRSGLTPPSP